MKVVIDNEDYYVSWKYNTVTPVVDYQSPRLETICIIKKGADKKAESVASASVRAYHKDRVSKNAGRKYSLDRALKSNPIFSSAADRKLFWDEYAKSRNGSFDNHPPKPAPTKLAIVKEMAGSTRESDVPEDLNI